MAEPRLIAALAYRDVQLLDIVGPLEAFNLAALQQVEEGLAEEPPYRVTVIAPGGESPPSMSGLRLAAGRSLDHPLDDVHTLIVPGARTGGWRADRDPEIIAWLRRAAGQVERVCSVCSGALLLAAAGLLEGRRATTHWMDADELQRCYPGVRVEANRIYVEDGGVWTSGGVTAGIDLALALIERDHGRRLALATARRLLVFLKRPGDQSQFSAFLEAQAHPGRFEELLDWLPEHLEQPLDTAALARRACMSERNFRRRFAAEFGLGPARYLRRARIAKARGLLEMTDLTLAAVARRCGFGSADALRYAFRAELEVTPGEYRQRFGGGGAGEG